MTAVDSVDFSVANESMFSVTCSFSSCKYTVYQILKQYSFGHVLNIT